MKISLYTIIAFAATGLHARGQQPARTPGLSPIPTVMAGRTIPLDSKQYVYLGPTTRELTISYPSELDLGGLPGQRRTFTIKLLNQVMPIVSTRVTENPDGTFNYVYTIKNDATARDAIKVWSIGLYAADGLLSASGGRWRTVDRRAPGAEKAFPGSFSMTPVTFADWRDSEGGSVAPGQTLTNVIIRSAYRPGFTTLYARSDEDFDVPEDLPAAVRAQLDVVRTLG